MSVDQTIVRPPLAPLKRDFMPHWHTPAQLDLLKRATLDILETVGREVPVRQGARDPRRAMVPGRSRPAGRALPARPRARGDGDVRRATSTSAPATPAATCSIADDTTYCTTDGCGVEIVDFGHGRAARRRPRPTSRASRACTDYLVVDRVLVADGLGRRLWRDRAAARARRRLEQHRQAPAGHGAGRARGALRGRDGDGDRRQRRGAAPPPGAERPHRHDLAARAGQRRHRGGARVRRGRRAGHVRHHADAGDDGAGDAGPARSP